ncbi:threonylcarbamoyladenosine tRNA methylthiotransferase [Labeo rohita]|uniref:Threonylcarbamoyladenosine tRNA methylthiotransferase n=1 Tax=Labeo rohita TaxID=84645 RepID=A0A498M4U3_LABRO|nr:threonylcarbamoyladenosine tRNA methylthiotransferase [Labeo rohita]
MGPSFLLLAFHGRVEREETRCDPCERLTAALNINQTCSSPPPATIGERQHVLVTEESFDAQYFVAHNKFYEQVLVPKKPEFKGKMIEVDIYEAGKHYVKGRPVEDAQVFTPSIAQPLQKGQVSGLPQSSFEVFRSSTTFTGSASVRQLECDVVMMGFFRDEQKLADCTELKASHQNGVCASVASSALAGRSWRFDGDGLKLLTLGLALAAVIVALVIDKLH